MPGTAGNPRIDTAAEVSPAIALEQAKEKPLYRVLIPFATPHLYGMERTVIQTFDALRPQVEPTFIQGSMICKAGLPVIQELGRRGLAIALLPDKKHWPQLGKPRSFSHLCAMLQAGVLSNITVLRAAWDKDALYVAGTGYGHMSILAALLYRLTGRKVIHRFHDLEVQKPTFRFWSLLVTDFVHSTELGYKLISEKFPSIRRRHNVVLPCLVEAEARNVEDSEGVRSLQGRRNLFFAGQVSKHKGVDVLLEAFKPLAQIYPDVMLHLVGGCSQDFRAEFERTLSQPPLAGRVRLWGIRSDALMLMRHAYIYVHTTPPSRCRESFGRSVVESMSLEVPTVCFRSGALEEIVVDGKTGLLCDESISALTDALRRMLDDPMFRDSCARNARQRFETLYSKEVVSARWRKFFTLLLSAR